MRTFGCYRLAGMLAQSTDRIAGDPNRGWRQRSYPLRKDHTLHIVLHVSSGGWRRDVMSVLTSCGIILASIDRTSADGAFAVRLDTARKARTTIIAVAQTRAAADALCIGWLVSLRNAMTAGSTYH